MSRDSVLVILLGGTISMTTHQSDRATPSLGAAELVAQTTLDPDVIPLDFLRRPSAHLTLADVVAVSEHIELVAGEHCGVVVVQGTDTIEEVAFALDLLCRVDITVVVTGAMRHASALSPDGAANLADSVAVARDPACRHLGVLVVLAGEIHAASLVRKAHPFAVHAFRSSPGALGVVVEGAPSVQLRPVRRLSLGPVVASADADADVEVITATLGATSRTIERLADDPPDALVVEGFGGGHVPPSWVAPLEALARRIPVVLCSRTHGGPALRATYGFDGSETDLLGRGLLHAGALDGPKAAVALRLLLARGADRAEVTYFFVS